MDDDVIARLSAEGWTTSRIADELGWARSTVHNARLRLGHQVRPYVDDAEVARLTRQGWGAQRIAEKLGCTPRTVVRARGRTGVAQPPCRHFTAEEHSTIESMLEDGCSLHEIERTIGRNHGALASHPRYRGRGWTKQQVAEYASILRKLRHVV